MPDGLPTTPEGQQALMQHLLTMADGPIDQALIQAGISQPRVVPQAPVTQPHVFQPTENPVQAAPAEPAQQPAPPEPPAPPDPVAVLAYQVQQLAEQNRALLQHLQPPPPDPQAKIKEAVAALQTEDGVNGDRLMAVVQTAIQPIQEQNQQLLQRIARSEMPEDFKQREPEVQAFLHQNPQVLNIVRTAWGGGDYKGALEYAYAMYQQQHPVTQAVDRRENLSQVGITGPSAQASRAQAGAMPQGPQRVGEEGLKIAAKAWNSGDQRPVIELLKTLLPDEPFQPVQTVWPIQ